MKKKKEAVKNEFCLVYTNPLGQVHKLTEEEMEKFANTSVELKHILDLLRNPDRLESEPNVEEKKFEKTATKILSHFMRHERTLRLDRRGIPVSGASGLQSPQHP